MYLYASENIIFDPNDLLHLQVSAIQKRKCWNSIKRRHALRPQLWNQMINRICGYIKAK